MWRMIPKKKLKVKNNIIIEFSNSNQNGVVYQLPDGELINIGSQRFRCAEALFDPMLIGKELKGFHQLIYCSILNSDIDVRKQLYENIVLSGGTTMFPNI